jgi:hypothetical protein
VQEEREVMFMKDTLCPRLEAAGVKPKTELVRIMAAGNKAIANALCKRAENLKPDFLVCSLPVYVTTSLAFFPKPHISKALHTRAQHSSIMHSVK